MLKSYGSFIVFFIAASFSNVAADRGMLPIIPGISVYEPGQKAIIAWSGSKEILILSTDVYADESTKVLEVLPLPSKPVVKDGNFKSFEVVQKIIESHRPPYSLISGDAKANRTAHPPGMAILFYKKIGAHSITCVDAADWDSFTAFLKTFVEKEGITTVKFPEGFSDLIEKYIKNRFNFFILDVVEVGKEKNSIEPIVYSFKTPYLYFPLEISSIVPGETNIDLFLLSKHKLNLQDTGTGLVPGLYYGYNYHPEPEKSVEDKTVQKVNEETSNIIQLELTPRQQRKISKDIDRLFWGNVYLSTLRYHGETDGLRNDLLLK